MYCKQCGACLPDGTAACPACGCLLAPAPAPEAPAGRGEKEEAMSFFKKYWTAIAVSAATTILLRILLRW